MISTRIHRIKCSSSESAGHWVIHNDTHLVQHFLGDLEASKHYIFLYSNNYEWGKSNKIMSIQCNHTYILF